MFAYKTNIYSVILKLFVIVCVDNMCCNETPSIKMSVHIASYCINRGKAVR